MFDGQHLRVIHGLAQEGQHAVKTLKGLVHQDVALAQLRKDGLPMLQLRRVRRAVGRETKIWPVHQVNELREAYQVHRAMYAVQRLGWQGKLLEQKVCQVLGTTGRHLQPHGLAVVAVYQALAQRGAQVLNIVLVHRQVRMASDTELRELPDHAPRKQGVQVCADHTRERHKQGALARYLVGHANQAWQYPRHFHNRDFVFAPKSILATEPDDEIERLVGHLGKGVRGVQPHRDQQRADFALKVLAHPGALGRVAVAMRDDADALALKGGHELLVVQRVLARHQGVQGVGQAFERRYGELALAVVGQAGREVRLRAYLKELVEIAGHNAKKPQALQQGYIVTYRPIQYPLIKSQEAMVAIQQIGRGQGRFDKRLADNGHHENPPICDTSVKDC